MNPYVSKRLRLTQKGYENYSGPIGAYEFVDGVSEELIPLNARNRLAAAFQMVEIEEDGTAHDASVAARMLRDRELQASLAEPLARMSEADKAAENISSLLGAEALKPLYSRAALEAVAEEAGIAGVRVIAEAWDVRSKSIPDLIQMIEKAQADYRTDRIEALTAKGADRAEVEALFVLRDEKPGVEVKPRKAADSAPVAEPAVEPAAEPVADPALPDAVIEAAVSGDLAAALNAE